MNTAKIVMLSIFVFNTALGILFLASSHPAMSVQVESHSAEYQTAFFEAAKTYGKVGCGDQPLAEMTARNSLKTGLPARVIAAMASAESTCNPLAVSNRGAIGLTQVMPKIWSKQFDFSKINLFNPEENMAVGTTILSGLVKQYGLKAGLARYYGTGPDAIGLGGAGYAEKVLSLAGKL
jgi:soluble lytic murein transglycosylase-like protein